MAISDLLEVTSNTPANDTAVGSHLSHAVGSHLSHASTKHSRFAHPSHHQNRSRSRTISAHSSTSGSPRFSDEPRRSRSKSRNQSRISVHNNSQDNLLLHAAISKHFQSRYAALDEATPEVIEPSRALNSKSQINSAGNGKLTRSVSSHSFLALQNQGHGSQRNKNIPMKSQNNAPVSNSCQVNTRPSIKRWKTYSMDTASTERANPAASNKIFNSRGDTDDYLVSVKQSPANKDIIDSSVSPLTVLKNNYNTSSPSNANNRRQQAMPFPSTTDNSFSELASGQSDKPTSRLVNSTDTPSTTVTSATNKIYNKVSHLVSYAHSSLNSIVPSYVRQAALDSADDTKRKPLRYESESDEDEADVDEADAHDIPTRQDQTYNPSKSPGWHKPHDIVTSPYVDASINDLTNVSSVDINEMVQDINDFQDSFVKKMLTPPSDDSPTGDKYNNVSRIQQKVLDYRDLYSEEELSKKLKPKPSFGSLPVKGRTSEKSVFESSLDYSIKIQHDTIMSEYTQIRLRFTSAPSKSSMSQARMTSHMGVLGYINRAANNTPRRVDERDPWHTPRRERDTWHTNTPRHDGRNSWHVQAPSGYLSPESAAKPQPSVTFENKDDYLKTLWDTELHSTFNTANLASEHTPVESGAFPHPTKLGSSSGQDIGSYEQIDSSSSGIVHEKKGSYDASHQNFASIARNVKLRT